MDLRVEENKFFSEEKYYLKTPITLYCENPKRINFLVLLMSKNFARMSKKVLAILSTGSEEMEFTITVDILRRAGVSFAGLTSDNILLYIAK